VNLEKYKTAKSKGDEKAIAKFTKIAGQLSKKKKAASETAQKAYDEMDNAISGLHRDAELQIDEADTNNMPAISINHIIKETIQKVVASPMGLVSKTVDDEEVDEICGPFCKGKKWVGKKLGLKGSQMDGVDRGEIKAFLEHEYAMSNVRKHLTEADIDMNDPFLVQTRVMRHAAKERKALDAMLKAQPKVRQYKISFDKYMELLDTQMFLQQDLKELGKQLKQMWIDMEQEAEPEGGPKADQYGRDLMRLEAEYKKVKAKLDKVDARVGKYAMY